MIPKSPRPKVDDLRPIAMTDTSYKILMSVVTQKIENHICANGMMHCEQIGFTRGGSPTDNFFILGECVEETFRTKNMLMMVSVDFLKSL